MTKRSAPATARNREPILAILREELPAQGTVLEIAAGTGEHAVCFAPALPSLRWLPSDSDEEALASIAAWRNERPAPNLLPPLRLDVTAQPWPVETDPPEPPISAILAINLIHISPFEVTGALMAGAGRILPLEGVLCTYGPYRVDGRHTAPSNAAFDAWLKEQDSRWGVRDVEEVVACAREAGLALVRKVEMPANNLSLVFRRRAP